MTTDRDQLVKAHIRAELERLSEGARERTRHALLSGAPMSELVIDDFDVVWVCGPAPLGGSSGRVTVLDKLTVRDIELMVEDMRLTEPDGAFRLAAATGQRWSDQLNAKHKEKP